MTRETPETVARTLTVTATAVLQQQVDLRAYPYRHLAVLSHRGAAAEQVTQAVAAADVLSHAGWELAGLSEFASSRLVYAFMRR